jgi:hypothetical protein
VNGQQARETTIQTQGQAKKIWTRDLKQKSRVLHTVHQFFLHQELFLTKTSNQYTIRTSMFHTSII